MIPQRTAGESWMRLSGKVIFLVGMVMLLSGAALSYGDSDTGSAAAKSADAVVFWCGFGVMGAGFFLLTRGLHKHT